MKLTQICLLLIVLMSCSKSDPTPGSQGTYIVLSNETGHSYGAISYYDVATNNFGAQAYRSSRSLATPPLGLDDVITDSDKIYVVNKYSRTVDMLGIKYYSVEKSYTFGKSSGSYGYKHLALSGTKLFVSDLYAGGSQPQSFLKAIDLSSSKVDSIGITSSGYIYGLLPAAGKIFVSTFEVGSGRVHVFDPSNYSKLTTISLPAAGFYPVGSKDFVYCVSANNLVKINTTTFAITQIPLDVVVLGTNTSGSLSSSSLAIDEDNNMLYYLASAPPPSTASYLLKSFDLTNQVSKTIIGTPFAAQSIAYDPQRKLILVAAPNDPNAGGPSAGDLGAINFFDLQGNAKGTFTMADRPEKVVVMH